MDVSQYKVGVVLSVQECGGNKGNKSLRSCVVNVGNNTDPVTIVTAASNVREGSRLAVALAGSTVLTDEGESLEVKRTSVGGTMSDGMFCNGKMLGWVGGSGGNVAQLIPDDFEIGSVPPSTKPRPKESETAAAAAVVPAVEVKPLFEKKVKLTKEEKKKQAEERKKARAAKKAAKAGDDGGDEEGEDES